MDGVGHLDDNRMRHTRKVGVSHDGNAQLIVEVTAVPLAETDDVRGRKGSEYMIDDICVPLLCGSGRGER